MRRLMLILFVLPTLLFGSPALAQSAQEDDRALRLEEEEDYYRKWLTEDVVYIINDEEEEVFNNLTTPEEKEQFIEQFWIRRDPDPTTAENEFKEEHYRRIAYSNETFASGEPGWMTDRGRVYIIHGPPTSIEQHPAGGPYHRPMHEGGGSTSTFPFEIWWYRNMEGVGSDIELEFVDRNGGNQYKLVLDPNYKDVMLMVQGAGQTLAEEMGIATKNDRPYFSPLNEGRYPLMWKRAKDNPFVKYETFAAVKRPKDVKYKDLQEIVSVNIDYNNLPFQMRQDFFNLNDNQVIVPITVELDNKELSFENLGPDYVARLAIYGMVTSIKNRIESEFEDEVTTQLRAGDFQRGLLGRSLYQKIVVLDKKMRYKLDIVVKDLNSGQVGAIRQAIIPPGFDGESLAVSSLMLSDFIHDVDDTGKDDQMFVLGDVWIRPSLSKQFPSDKSMGLYLQVYNFGVDQSTLTPEIEAEYRVFRDSKPVLELVDETGKSVHFFSGRRIVLVRQLPITLLEPGDYRVEIVIRDRIKNQEILATDQFKLTQPTG